MIRCAALTQTHPELFPTMSTVLILLLTPMRRILVHYEIELGSYFPPVHIPQHTGISRKDNETYVIYF